MSQMADNSLPLEVPSGLRRELSQVNANLYTAVTVWLRKHGKVRRGGGRMPACGYTRNCGRDKNAMQATVLRRT